MQQKGRGQAIDEIILPKNKYGYQINITHPKIKPLYERYKKWKNISNWCPLSDEERLEFESYILKKTEGKDETKTN